jgi:CelD/BcsL family acetyltransferase involved in cellulose biosynthesis
MQIFVQVVNDIEILQPLIGQLVEQLPYTIHQKIDWYRAYIKAFNPNILCLLVQNKKTKRPIGILPLQVHEYRGTRFWNLRRLVPLAHGPSDFVNLLVEPSKEQEFADALAWWFSRNDQFWEQLSIPYIPAESPAWQVLVQALEIYGFYVEVDKSHGFWEVNTNTDWNVYFSNFFYQNNKDLLKDIRRLQREGQYPHLVIVRSNIAYRIRELLPLYQQRRRTRGEWYKYEDPRHIQFLVDVIQAYERIGAVELSILQDNNGIPWAYQLDWIDKGVRYHWMHAYNEEFKKYSPGKILLYELLRKSFEDPTIHKCNFMRGEAEYKKRLANIRREYVNILVHNTRSLRAQATRIASWLARLRDSVLQLR